MKSLFQLFREYRPATPARAFAENLSLLLLAAIVFCLTGYLVSPVMDWPSDVGPWSSPQLQPLRFHVVGSLQALAALGALAFLHRGPSLRTLFRPQPVTGMLMALGGASAILGGALLVNLSAIRDNTFFPIRPSIHAEFLMLALVGIVLAALFEELVYRALLQTLFSRLFGREWAGLVVSAVLFTAMHDPRSLSMVLPAGLLFGLVFLRTRSVTTTTALHVAMNIALELLAGRKLTMSPFLAGDEVDRMRPAVGLALLLLAVAIELWYRRSLPAPFLRRPTTPPAPRTPPGRAG